MIYFSVEKCEEFPFFICSKLVCVLLQDHLPLFWWLMYTQAWGTSSSLFGTLLEFWTCGRTRNMDDESDQGGTLRFEKTKRGNRMIFKVTKTFSLFLKQYDTCCWEICPLVGGSELWIGPPPTIHRETQGFDWPRRFTQGLCGGAEI